MKKLKYKVGDRVQWKTLDNPPKGTVIKIGPAPNKAYYSVKFDVSVVLQLREEELEPADEPTDADRKEFVDIWDEGAE